MSNNNILVETRGNVLLMGINRPEKRNAFTLDMYFNLARAYYELDRNKDLRCGLLYAVGDHFTSGLDLPQWGKVFADGKLDLEEDMLDPYGLLEERRCRKPVVMACQGMCFTWGIEIMLACDVRVAANDLQLAQLEVKRGIYAVGGATTRLWHEIGWGNAMRYVLTGDKMNGQEAYRLGLVQELVEPGQQFDRALAFAEAIAKAAPLGVQASLASARQARDYGNRVAMQRIPEFMPPIMKSKDAQEGVQAFLERREPNFTGE